MHISTEFSGPNILTTLRCSECEKPIAFSFDLPGRNPVPWMCFQCLNGFSLVGQGLGTNQLPAVEIMERIEDERRECQRKSAHWNYQIDQFFTHRFRKFLKLFA